MTEPKYVAKFHLDAQAQPGFFHAASLPELAEWAAFHSMAIGALVPGTNFYQPSRVDGSPLTDDELKRLPRCGVEDNRMHWRMAARLDRHEGMTLAIREAQAAIEAMGIIR